MPKKLSNAEYTKCRLRTTQQTTGNVRECSLPLNSLASPNLFGGNQKHKDTKQNNQKYAFAAMSV